MSGVFSSAQRPIFIDWCHVSEWGNEQVAGKMAADTIRLLGADDFTGSQASNQLQEGLPEGRATPPGFFQFLVR